MKKAVFSRQAAEVLREIGEPKLLPILFETLLITAEFNILNAISGIQTRYKFYNYTIATSSPLEEENKVDPLTYTLNILNQTLKTMSETPNYDFSGASFGNIVGSVTGNIEGDNIATQHNYAPEQKQNLVEAAKEIQQLLEQLSQTYPTTTQAQQQAVVTQAIEQEIKRNPTFKARLRNALKEGGIEALKVLFAPIGIPIEMVRGWIEAE